MSKSKLSESNNSREGTTPWCRNGYGGRQNLAGDVGVTLIPLYCILPRRREGQENQTYRASPYDGVCHRQSPWASLPWSLLAKSNIPLR